MWTAPPATPTQRIPPEVLAELRRLSREYAATLRELAELRGNGPLPDRAHEYARRDRIAATLARLAALQEARSRFVSVHDLPTRLGIEQSLDTAAAD